MSSILQVPLVSKKFPLIVEISLEVGVSDLQDPDTDHEAVLLEKRKDKSVFPKCDLNPDNCPVCLLSRNLLKIPSIRRVYFEQRKELDSSRTRTNDTRKNNIGELLIMREYVLSWTIIIAMQKHCQREFTMQHG